MGCQDVQIEMVTVDIGEPIPWNYLLKRIEKHVAFGFVYALVEPHYSRYGRPCADPVSVIKMMRTGYPL